MKKFLMTTGKIVAFFLGWAVLAGLIEIPGRTPAIWRFWAEFVPLAVLAVFTILFCRAEKGRVRIPILARAGRAAAAGSLTGLCWIGISAAVLLLILFTMKCIRQRKEGEAEEVHGSGGIK